MILNTIWVKMRQIVSPVLRITGVAYIVMLFVADVIILPVNRLAIEALVENIRYVILFYSCIIFLHYYIEYGVSIKDRNLYKIPSVVKRKVGILLIFGFLWMLAVDYNSEIICQSLAGCHRVVLWLFDAVYFVPFTLPCASSNHACADSDRCEPLRMWIECVLTIFFLVCMYFTVTTCLRSIKSQDFTNLGRSDLLRFNVNASDNLGRMKGQSLLIQ